MVHINYTFIGRSGFDFKDLEYRTLSLKILIANILQHGVHVTIKKKTHGVLSGEERGEPLIYSNLLMFQSRGASGLPKSPEDL